MGRMAKMNTVGETFKVDAGTTIRLPCHIDNLHGMVGNKKSCPVFHIRRFMMLNFYYNCESSLPL